MSPTHGQRLRLVTSSQPPPFAPRFCVRHSRCSSSTACGGSWLRLKCVLHLTLGLWECFCAPPSSVGLFDTPLVSVTPRWWICSGGVVGLLCGAADPVF
ncbi:hypothetical protein Pyn_34144 [Prunus yedoensis var. nudiflora]|uniref:Uncharacterized protein n=1 Tax=Prunus yedoensis var. nudiflora TaxID=2094558 RepID=A0A314XN34_PRUYE|nr:hypothetical protein Pyn_34144 [Prunus yedoensis var. nudiflora]